VVIYFALIWLLYQNYNQTQEIEKMYDKLDKVVRQLALKDINADKVEADREKPVAGNSR